MQKKLVEQTTTKWCSRCALITGSTIWRHNRKFLLSNFSVIWCKKTDRNMNMRRWLRIS